jgi:oligopeptide/dipeptide ABC transporter ATP-binding protein
MDLLSSAGTVVESTCIEINGTDISTLKPAERRQILGRDIAMVFQQPGTALDPVFTIGKQIDAVYRRHIGGSSNQIRQATLGSLEQVGFDRPEKIARAYPHQLSGGMRQLAMIAMAMVCKPAVLIADEPTTALDAGTRALILHQIKRLQSDYNTAIFLISHDLSVIRQSCRQVMVMYCGRIVEQTDSHSLFAHARHPYSAGLIACIPEISATRPATISAIPGQVPAPANLPPGCHFAPRCEYATTRCTEAIPVLESSHQQAVACFRPL